MVNDEWIELGFGLSLFLMMATAVNRDTQCDTCRHLRSLPMVMLFLSTKSKPCPKYPDVEEPSGWRDSSRNAEKSIPDRLRSACHGTAAASR